MPPRERSPAPDEAQAERVVAIDPVVERAAAGDQDAFQELFRENAPWVYGRLRRMLGTRSDLEDLVQEVFVRAYRSLPSYRGQARFESWLKRICACVAYDDIRSRRNVPRLEVLETETMRTSREEDPERREAVRHLMRIIDALPPQNRIVLLLHDLEGYTAEEIQLVVGAKSVNTVRSRLRLARAELHRRGRANPALSSLYSRSRGEPWGS
jgi:RNA polymerase sigma-70 factor (ECF subfamily)